MKRLASWLPILAYSMLIFYASSRSITIPTPGWKLIPLDKVLHFSAYTVWSLLFALPLAVTWPRLRPLALATVAFVGGAVYGASDEFHQSFVPGREADLGDVAADALGALLGGAIAAFVTSCRAKSERRRTEG